MEEKKKFQLRFNQIFNEEMRKHFTLRLLPLDPDFQLKYSGDDANAYIKSEYWDCPKTAGIRVGETDFRGSMTIQFGNVPPAKQYNFPILGYTFLCANKCLIVVLDLLPISRDKEYMGTYFTALREVSQKYAWIPPVEGGRTEVHEWAKVYDSGYSLYRWCDGKYMANMEDAFREYVHIFCDCISKAEPLSDPKMVAQRNKHIEQYNYDYLCNDPGNAPLKSYFGNDWAERYMKEFLFAP